MITLRVWRDADGNVVRYRLNGHSPSGEAGNNLVCAAVSALAIAATNGLEAAAGASANAHSSPGHLDCEVCWPTEPEGESIRLKAQAVVDTMLLGMQSISREHPRDLRVIDERNAGN